MTDSRAGTGEYGLTENDRVLIERYARKLVHDRSPDDLIPASSDEVEE